MFVHTVFFWLRRDLADAKIERFEAALATLPDVPGVAHGHWGPPAPTRRPVIDSTYDYGLTLVFPDQPAHDAYQVHPTHLRFVEICGDFWERVVVYDVQADEDVGKREVRIRRGRRWVMGMLALALAMSAAWASGCGNVHPVHWTKLGVSAARGDAGAVRERMKLDPEAGQYVRMAEEQADAWMESVIVNRDAAGLKTVLSTRPVLNTKLPESGKTPLALAKSLGWDEGVRQLRAAGAKR